MTGVEMRRVGGMVIFGAIALAIGTWATDVSWRSPKPAVLTGIELLELQKKVSDCERGSFTRDYEKSLCDFNKMLLKQSVDAVRGSK